MFHKCVFIMFRYTVNLLCLVKHPLYFPESYLSSSGEPEQFSLNRNIALNLFFFLEFYAIPYS